MGFSKDSFEEELRAQREFQQQQKKEESSARAAGRTCGNLLNGLIEGFGTADGTKEQSRPATEGRVQSRKPPTEISDSSEEENGVEPVEQNQQDQDKVTLSVTQKELCNEIAGDFLGLIGQKGSEDLGSGIGGALQLLSTKLLEGRKSQFTKVMNSLTSKGVELEKSLAAATDEAEKAKTEALALRGKLKTAVTEKDAAVTEKDAKQEELDKMIQNFNKLQLELDDVKSKLPNVEVPNISKPHSVSLLRNYDAFEHLLTRIRSNLNSDRNKHGN